MLLLLLALLALLIAPAWAAAQTRSVQNCPGGRCPLPGGFQPPHSFREPPAEAAPPHRQHSTAPTRITREQLTQANAGYGCIVWYDKTDPRWPDLHAQLQPGCPLRTRLERWGRIGFRNLGDPRNAPYAAAAGVEGITIHVHDWQFSGWSQIDELVTTLGTTPFSPPPPDEPPPASPPVAGCDCADRLCAIRRQLQGDIDQRLQTIEQRLQANVDQFDASLQGWQALADEQTAQIHQLRSQCDQRWEALDAALPAIADNQQQLAALQQRLAQIEQRLAALQQKTEVPFEVELFSDGESVAGPRSVRPHGGYLPIDVSGVLEDAAPIP